MSALPPSGRRALFLGGGLLLVAGTVFLLRLDASLKSGGVPRLAPPSAAWVLSSPDFPGFWVGFRNDPLGEAFRRHYPQGQAALVLRARLLAGIRPTPDRWNLWLGSPAVLSGGDGHWCLVTRPGVAARAAILVGGLLGNAGTFRGMHYRWRDGLLVLSDSAEWSAELRETPAPPPDVDTKDPVSSSVLLTFSKGWARATAVCGDSRSALLLDGALHLPDKSDPSDKPETAATLPLLEWPGRPALTCCAADGPAFRGAFALLRQGAEALLGDSPLKGVLSAAATRWGASLSGVAVNAPGDRDGAPFAGGAVYGLHWDGAAPLPEVAGIWRGALPSFDDIRRNLQDPARRTAEWEGREGLALPLLGDAFSLCLWPGDGGVTLGASNAPLMARLAASPPAMRQTVSGMFLLRADGPALAGLLQETFARAADEGWLEDTTPRELERTVLPLLRVVEGAGRLEVTVKQGGEGLVWQGGLSAVSAAIPAEKTP